MNDIIRNMEKASFLINSTSELEKFNHLKELEFDELLENLRKDYTLGIEKAFEQPNFEGVLRKNLKLIINSINFVKRQGDKNKRSDTLVKCYEFAKLELKTKFYDMYSSVFNEAFSFSLVSGLPPMKLEDMVKTPLFKKQSALGTEEYYKKHKFNETFCDFYSFKLFFDFITLFKENGKYDLNISDASFIYRKLYEKKYIIESVSQNDFKNFLFDKIDSDLDYSLKLKVLAQCTTKYKEIIFALIEKQNRSQKVQNRNYLT